MKVCFYVCVCVRAWSLLLMALFRCLQRTSLSQRSVLSSLSVSLSIEHQFFVATMGSRQSRGCSLSAFSPLSRLCLPSVADKPSQEDVVTYLRTRKTAAVGGGGATEEDKALAPDSLPHSLSTSGFSDISSDTHVTAPDKTKLPKVPSRQERPLS